MKNQTFPMAAWKSRSAFTLVELMIAISVAILLIVGVGYIFRKAADTVAMGQTLATLSRDNRSLQATMNDDFNNFAIDTPLLIIQSRPQIGYIDAGDYQTDSSSANGGSFDPSQSGIYITTSQALQIPTVHRQDVLGFCIRGKNQRRASATGLTDTTGSVEAFVWYGMLAMLDNSYGTYWQPAQGETGGTGGSQYLSVPADNPNNFYGANQWTLGRVCILLRPDASSADPAGGYFPPAPPPPQNSTLSAEPMQPLQGGTLAIISGASTNIPIESDTLDLAMTNIQTCRDAITQQFSNRQGTAWVDELAGMPIPSAPAQGASPFFAGGLNTNTKIGSPAATGTRRAFNSRTWLNKPLIATPNTTNATQGNVYTAFDQSSMMASSLMPGVTQFIVEYAGDYLNQRNDPGQADDGQVLNIWTQGGTLGSNDWSSLGWTGPTCGQTDGKLDFVVDPDGTHRIRWYGFPRDVAGMGVTVNASGQPVFNTSLPWSSITNRPDSSIPSVGSKTTSYQEGTAPGTAPPAPSPALPYMPDVVPLRDVIQTTPENYLPSTHSPPEYCGNWENMHAPFEWTTSGGMETFTNRATGTSSDYVTQMLGYSIYSPYTCVWGPQDQKPWLIRVTITVNDPNRTIKDGQTFEYIFYVPH